MLKFDEILRKLTIDFRVALAVKKKENVNLNKNILFYQFYSFSHISYIFFLFYFFFIPSVFCYSYF